MKFRKKPVVVDAHQWHQNGDHPEDNCAEPGAGEGRVVGFYRDPSDDDGRPCQHCHRPMGEHGWVNTLEGGHIVCPGDWIITGIRGEKYPCKPDVFERTYEPAE